MKTHVSSWILVAGLVFVSSSAWACQGNVVSIPVLENGATVVVTLRDNSGSSPTCNPVTIGSISPAGLSNCAANAVNFASAAPPPTKVAVTPDVNGASYDFKAVSGAIGMGACTVSLNHADGSNVVGTQVTVSLSDGVTVVQPTSP